MLSNKSIRECEERADAGYLSVECNCDLPPYVAPEQHTVYCPRRWWSEEEAAREETAMGIYDLGKFIKTGEYLPLDADEEAEVFTMERQVEELEGALYNVGTTCTCGVWHLTDCWHWGDWHPEKKEWIGKDCRKCHSTCQRARGALKTFLETTAQLDEVLEDTDEIMECICIDGWVRTCPAHPMMEVSTWRNTYPGNIIGGDRPKYLQERADD